MPPRDETWDRSPAADLLESLERGGATDEATWQIMGALKAVVQVEQQQDSERIRLLRTMRAAGIRIKASCPNCRRGV